MERDFEKVKEETAHGKDNMDLSWMISFWESFTECVVELDDDNKITNIRRKADSSFSLKNIVGKSFLDIVDTKDVEFVASNLMQLKKDSVPYLRFQFLSILNRYYRWTLVPFYKNGAYGGCHGVAVDVTEQTLKEITLNWQRAVIEEGRDFVRIFDMQGQVLYSNPGVCKMTGYDSNSQVPPSKQLYTEAHYKTVYEEGLKTVLKEGYWIGRGELVRADGKLVPIEHTMLSIKDNNEEIILVATVIRDITEFLEQEKKLEEARLAAEVSNIAKSEFLSRMSHEIRTPMNAIIGMINIGMNTDDVGRKNNCFSRADIAAKHLLGLINDILDMSKIEADKFELMQVSFDFEKALKNIANIANVRAEEKQLNFVINIGSDVPLFIYSDEMRLSQVITNLLTNAMKFTPERGSVVLSIDKIEDSGDAIVLRFEVADTGIGISLDQQKKLFTSFNQANAGISQKYGGTGLGLAISKRIVDFMGGKIWVESELGEGSKFIFTIKTKKTQGKSRTKLHEKINIRKTRILAVDDSPETREYFCHAMEALRLQCDVAESGQAALRMVRESKDNPYSIFFIDWQMPEMDGIELTRKIKEINGENSIVIMISAHDWNTIEKNAVAAGVNHFVPKPLFPSTLIDSINICMGEEIEETDDGEEISARTKRFDFSKNTILVAEDVEINREIMSAILEETDVSIDYAENGKIAVEMFDKNPDKYDLILMDINMPEMDGYEATKIIRSRSLKRAKNIPIVAMTANVFREDIEKCIKAGMNDHTGKPVDEDELFGKLNRYLR